MGTLIGDLVVVAYCYKWQRVEKNIFQLILLFASFKYDVLHWVFTNINITETDLWYTPQDFILFKCFILLHNHRVHYIYFFLNVYQNKLLHFVVLQWCTCSS